MSGIEFDWNVTGVQKKKKEIHCMKFVMLFYSVGQPIVAVTRWFTVVLMSKSLFFVDWTVAGLQSFVS